MQEQFEEPIILFIFNRPQQTQLVFERICGIRPSRLFVVADGPRPHVAEDIALCEETRTIVSKISWPCEVITNFTEHNLGCRDRIVSGLNWAFSQVDSAIILEDDILPDPSFFYFCAEMLERFRNDERVGMISGFNVAERHVTNKFSYNFSRLIHCWGWATWARAWRNFDPKMESWPELKAAGLLSHIFERHSAVRFWTKTFDHFYLQPDSSVWDYQWVLANFQGNCLSVVPRSNLIENIGFGKHGTHTTDEGAAPPEPKYPLDFPLIHPPSMVPNRKLDREDQILSGTLVHALPIRILRRVAKLFLFA